MKRASSKQKEMDLDPLSTNIIEDLLESNSEWKGINDIVKLTLKALTDVVRVQGASIRQINNTFPTRASKSELSTGLSLKANINDVSRTISQISNILESKLTLGQLHDVMKQYISREEFQDAMIVKGHFNDNRSTSKMMTATTNGDFRSEDIQKQISKKMSGYVTLNQFQQLLTIIEQKPNINEVNQILQNKVSKSVFNAALQKLVVRNEIQLALSKKADITDLEYIVSTLETKADLSSLQKLTQIMQNKADKSDVQFMISKIEQGAAQSDVELIFQAIEQLKIGLQKLGQDKEVPVKRFQLFDDKINNVNIALHSKISQAEHSAIMTNLKYQINEEIAKMKMHIRNHLSQDQNKTIELFSAKELLKQVSAWKKDKEVISKQIQTLGRQLQEKNSTPSKDFRKDYNEFKNNILLGLEEKLSTQQLQQVLAKWVQQIHIKINEEREDTLNVVKQMQQGVTLVLNQQSSEIENIRTSFSKKQYQQQNSIEEVAKRMRRDIDDIRKTVDKVYSQVQNKLSNTEYQSDLLDMRKKMDAIYKQLSLKSNIKDVCVLVDSKPNVEQINKALKQIHEQLEAKVCSEQIKSILHDQAAINQTLCEQNIVGRWLWHSGQMKAGNLVPWEAQTVNTLPHNFLWDKDQTSILTLASGLYQITVNVFSKYKSSISLIINGQVVVTRHPPIEQKQNINAKKKKGKQVISLKIHQFFMLPTRARLGLSYSGEPGSEGFLSVKRL